MGKASRWFRALLGLNKKKKWSFSRTHKERRPANRQPVVAVVKPTSTSSAAGYMNREDRAAVTIQSHFRAYLSRRALRALRALVKLQAVAKGYILRKQFTQYLRQMQAVARAQARARAGRVSNSEASNSSTKSSQNVRHDLQWPATPEAFDNRTKHRQLKLEGSRSPQCYSLTPTRSEGQGFYLEYPSYMAYTESSKAKVRSVSAPRQRVQEERWCLMNGFGDESSSVQRVSALQARFASKVYPGSGRLDRMGMPVRDVAGVGAGCHWQRF